MGEELARALAALAQTHAEQRRALAEAKTALAQVRKRLLVDGEPPTGVRYYVRKVYDGRICQACLDNDEVDELPVHPNCRCERAVDNGEEQPLIPAQATHIGIEDGDPADRFRPAPPIGDAPTDGYLVPDHPDKERVLHPQQVTETVIGQTQRDHVGELHEPDAHLAAWVTPKRVVLGIVRRFNDRTTARNFAKGLAAPVLNLIRGSIIGRLTNRTRKAAPPVLVLLPGGAGRLERAAFVAAVRAAAGLTDSRETSDG